MNRMLDKRKKLAASIALAVSSSCVLANPSGPQVVSGTATFSQPNANTLNVTNSRNAIINWQNFSIGAGQTTNFIQPSANSAVLNRVISNNPSRILGNLNSNGKVFLVNQHGLMIGAGAQINTAGFYGSTLNITNEDFLKGNLKFEGGGYGGIQNHGYIHAGPNGNVVLVAPDIENGGVIEVDNGNVILAAGESIRITSLNDAAIEFDVQSPDNGIINLGKIIAKQGAARLFAGNLKHSGSINATGIVRNADGSISLVAQQEVEVAAGASLEADGAEGGNIKVQSLEGDVVFAGEASARGETGNGGKIEILGERVGLFGDARVDTSGKTGGGEILVGGDFQGGGETPTARQTQVSRGASLHADATESGDGGRVIVWADGYTQFTGVATATGGSVSGDGGLIEVSGKDSLYFAGTVDTSAPHGVTGTVLFDPRNINVFAGSLVDYTPGMDDTFAQNPGVDVNFNNASIEAALNNNNVILQANNDILWSGPLSPTANNDLTLQAGRTIAIFDTQGVFSTNGGNLNLIANSTAADGVVDAERLAGAANILIGDGVQTATINTGGGNLNIEIRDGAGITNAQAGSIVFDGLSSTGTSGGLMSLVAPDVALAGGSLVLSGDTAFDGLFTMTGGVLDLSGATLALNGGFDWSGGSTIQSDGSGVLDLFSNSRSIGIGAHVISNVTVNNSANFVLSSAAADDFQLEDGTIFNNIGLFDIANDTNLESVTNASFNNAGVFRKSGGTGSSTVAPGITFSNSAAIIDVQSGNLNLNLPLLNLGAGDVLTGAGNYVGDVTNNGGTIRPGSQGTVGTLSVTGNFIQDAGTLEIDISAAAVFDQVVATTGTINGGSIDVNLLGHIPTVGEQQQVILCGSPCGGNFLSVTSPAGIAYSSAINVGGDNLTLTVDSVAFAWDGGGDGLSWTDGLNWSLDVAPNNTIDVLLPAVNVIVDGPAAANSLTLNGNLALVTGGTLTIEDSIVDLRVNAGASLTINGGTLVNLGDATLNGVFTLAAGNANFTGNVAFNGAFDISGGALNLIGGGMLMNGNNSWRGGTITGAAPLVLGMTPADGTTLALAGPANKILDTITLDMNLNDVNMAGAGDLVLANSAVVDNTGGSSFNHIGGDGGIVGVGQFNNTDGTYNHFGGNSMIAVDFTNTSNSIVNVSGGTLMLQDTDAGDLATYNIAGGGTFQINADRTFGDTINGLINSAGTVHVSGTAVADMQLLGGEFTTQNLRLDPGATLAGNPVTVFSNFLWGGGGLPSTLTTVPGSTMVISSAFADLSSVAANIQGDLRLAPGGTDLTLGSNTLRLNNSTLSGAGIIRGDVVNAGGVVVTGGAGNLADLQIEGNYTQGGGSALVVEVLNNGVNTVSEQLIVTGATNLQGGALVIGFDTSSLGLVTANFSPLDPQGGISGRFDRIFDAGGNILFFNFNGGVFTILGTSPKIPDAVIADLISFARESRELSDEVANNRSEAEAVMEELLKDAREEDGLSCKI